MRAEQHVLIVGGGIAGLAVGYFLQREEGVRVTLLEAESELGRHSTGRNAAILRSWTPDPVLTSLARTSSSFLHEPPPGFSDVPLVDPCGLILVTRRSVAEFLAVYREFGVEPPAICELTRERFEELAPHFRAEGAGRRWMHFPGEGRIEIPALVEGFARGIREAGGEVFTDTGVGALALEEAGVRGVHLADGTRLRGDLVVLAAGAWAGRLGELAGSRVRLRPTRRHIAVSEPRDDVDPRWPIVWSDDEGFYARPEDGALLCCACDQTDVDPDACAVDTAVLHDVSNKIAQHLPGLSELGTAHFWAGVRTLTDDGRFCVGPDPTVSGLFWAAGLGGHGMTSCAAVGRLASDQIVGRSVDPRLAAALAPGRAAPQAVVATRASSRS